MDAPFASVWLMRDVHSSATFTNLPLIIIVTAVATTVTAGHHTAYTHHYLIRAHYGAGGVNGESGNDGKERSTRSILNDDS